MEKKVSGLQPKKRNPVFFWSTSAWLRRARVTTPVFPDVAAELAVHNPRPVLYNPPQEMAAGNCGRGRTAALKRKKMRERGNKGEDADGAENEWNDGSAIQPGVVGQQMSRRQRK